jgi:hypothetical protein
MQTLGHRFACGFNPCAAQSGKLLWISFSGDNGVDDAQPCFADDITDDVAQLHVHFEERLLHVVDGLSTGNYQVVAQAHIGS